ncbi:Hypothetical protein (Fragment) [Durusdinium trenchii]|uniref:Uncharacterized protein n=1 Tax=Durusdinium trenchii TaxID=1381693 RepID=A0ABP0HAH3_9DINO
MESFASEVGSFASVESLMDLQSLGELFRKLHEEADAFARRESIKLFDQDKRNRQATSEKDLGVAKESVKIAPVMW